MWEYSNDNMTVEQFLDDLYEGVEGSGLSDSDRVYVEFRRKVDPGMFDAKFDVTPAKSCANRGKYTGERLIDQTLRSHLLNGAAFGARLNNALSRLDPQAALSDDELRCALAMFSCHDLHKTVPAQRRRAESTDRSDADKDISEFEVSRYVDLLRLDELGTGLEIADYRASALAAEEGSGRHRASPSRPFERVKDWIRVMDAAAGLGEPELADGLESRIQSISDEVELAFHRVDDTKGLLTNVLNSTLVERARSLDTVVPLVFFSSGVLYLSTDREALTREVSGNRTDANTLTESFIDTMREARDEFRNPRELTGSLSDDYQKARIEVPSSVCLLAGLETSIKSVKHLLTDRAEASTYDEYDIYRYATEVGVVGNLFGEPIPEASKAVPLGLELSSFYQEIYYPLSGEDRRAAITHIGKALGIKDLSRWVCEETDSWRLTFSQTSPSTEDIERIAEHLDVAEDDVREDLEDGISLESGGTLATPVLLGMLYLAHGRKNDTLVSELPLEKILRTAEQRLFEYYRSWPDDWDQRSDVDEDAAKSAKVEAFERSQEGMIWESFPMYLAQNLVVNGQRVLNVDQNKTKRDEYASPTQPHVCLVCHDLLEGSGSLSDFEADSMYFGFTHYRPVNPEDGEPSNTVCPQCQVELTLRSAVYDTADEGDAQFLFLAPDYFYGPGDVEFVRRVQEYVYLPGGFDLQRLASTIVTGDQNRRSRQIEQIFDIFGADGEEERMEFNNLIKNYNRAYTDDGALGVYRLDAPRRAGDDGGGTEPITRVPNWFVSALATTVISWLTSSRALLTESPIPVIRFEEFPEMVRMEHLPGQVQWFSSDSVTVSLLQDLDDRPHEIAILSQLTGQTIESTADDADLIDPAEALESSEDPLPPEARVNAAESVVSDSAVPVEIHLHTDLEVKLFALASLLTVTGQQHGSDVQRVKTVLERTKHPFPGAGTVLKGDEKQTYPAALHAALVLDTLQYPIMTNRIDKLADAGFQTLHPNTDRDTNHEYERLFRVARDALSDGLAKNATRDELVDIVSGDVMKAAARADESEYGEERVKRESAEEFANLFVDDVYHGICDGDFYELRRHENHLASGYNAAIRRRQQEFWDEHSSDTDNEQ